MIEDITLHAFDEIVNPILLCEMNGKVIYKNPEAQMLLKKPIHGGNLTTYLSKESKALFQEENRKENFPAFLEIESAGDYFCAFADVIYYESRPTLLLVISHLFLYQPAVSLFKKSKRELHDLISAATLARLATDLYTSESMLEAAQNRKHHRRMTEVFYRLVTTALTELAYGKDTVYYTVNNALDIIDYAAMRVLSRLGLDILFQMKYDDGDMMRVDFKPFVLFVSNFILLAAEISDSHIINACVTRDENDDVLITFSLTSKKAEEMIMRGSAEAFTALLPGRSFDLFFFDRACKQGNYQFRFAVRNEEKENLTMKLRSPIYRRVEVREQDLFRVEEAKRMIDEMLEKLLGDSID